MRINLKYNIVGLALLILFSIGCDKDQIVEDPISPDGYPMVTFTVDNDVDQIREGEALTYTIKTDKALDRALTFSVKYLGGTATEDDYTATTGTIEPYTTETQISITFNDDVTIEDIETLKFEIGVFGIGDKYLINPASKNLVKEITINPSTNLDISFGWNSGDDIDFVILKEDGSFYKTAVGSGGTLANPEVNNSISLDDVGTFYISILHWGAPNFDYTFNFQKPDATIETIEGTFKSDNLSAYYLDSWIGWGNSYDAYRVVKIVNDGTNFTFSKLDELGPSDYYDVSGLVGDWGGTDGTYSADYDWRFDSHVTTYFDGTTLTVDSLNYVWMEAIWEEEFKEIVPVNMVIYSNGDVVIPFQYHFTTLFDSDDDGIMEEYPYSIFARGSYDGTTLILNYELKPKIAGSMFGWGYTDIPYFVTELTLGSKSNTSINHPKTPGFRIAKKNIDRSENTFKK